jgi:hypothetical protein
MEKEQMMPHLLAEIRTGQEHMKEMTDTNQAISDTSLMEIKANQARDRCP